MEKKKWGLDELSGQSWREDERGEHILEEELREQLPQKHRAYCYYI